MIVKLPKALPCHASGCEQEAGVALVEYVEGVVTSGLQLQPVCSTCAEALVQAYTDAPALPALRQVPVAMLQEVLQRRLGAEMMEEVMFDLLAATDSTMQKG